MRILIVHQYYLMPGQQGGSRFNEMARFWSTAGHDVTVIAGTVDYATGHKPRRYRRTWTTVERDGAVTVIRCHVSPHYNRSYIGRMWAFLSFTLSSSTAALTAPRPDVVVATSPPLIAAIAGWLGARRAGVPFVFEVRDLWPESAITTGVLSEGSPLTRVLYLVERLACRTAERINALTPAFKADMVARNLAPPDKVWVIPNGADLDQFRPGPRDNAVRRELSWGDRVVFLYAGAHGRANALRQLIDVADRLRHRDDILFACVGDGPERPTLEADTRRRALNNLVFYGSQPKSQMCEFINAADVGVAVLQNNPTFHTVYPNKVFDYMACERPTLLGIDGVARRLVCDDAGAGLFAEPENVDALATAAVALGDSSRLRGELGRSGRQWVELNASRQALAAKYLELLSELSMRHPC